MNKLKELRKQTGLSQEAVGKILHISRQAYGFYENEKRAMPPAIMLKIADYYDVSLDELFGRVWSKGLPSCNMTTKEFEYIKKYRALDEHGKEAVNYTLEHEYIRSTKVELNNIHSKRMSG